MLSDSDNGNKENQAPASDAWEDDIGLLRPIMEDHADEVRENSAVTLGCHLLW